ncbi:hypothetical protein [Hyphomonas sp.]|uniref:hypothetical protein n=1 Tax=Hyphomonas sp. TaxID=87 RepID=UPI0030F89B7B
MKKIIPWAIVPVAVVACAIGYWAGPDLLSLQTVTITNDSENPVTVTVYDDAWTVAPHERQVERFSARGDAHFRILDVATGHEISAEGYLTSGMAQCHTITIGEQVTYDSALTTSCHLTAG